MNPGRARKDMPEHPVDDEDGIDRWSVEWETGGGQRRHVVLDRLLRVGRAVSMDIVLDDPFASREHCTIRLIDNRPFVDASGSLNHVEVGGQPVETAWLSPGESFIAGRTALVVRLARPTADATWVLRRERPQLSLRRSTRELRQGDGAVLVRFSAAEYAALAALASRYPDAADHAEIGRAVWGDYPYDQYQIHRLFQRIRQRLAAHGDLIENVRGAGYRLREPIDLG
jgi:hypothetical protein